MSEQKHYKVLRVGVSLRDEKAPGGFSHPDVGDVIPLSEAAAGHLVSEGWVEPLPEDEVAQPTPPRPRPKRPSGDLDAKPEVN